MKVILPMNLLKANRKAIGLTLFVITMLIGGLGLLHLVTDIPIGDLTRDPNVIIGAPFYNGLVSQIGIFFWAAAAAVCLFTAKALSTAPANFRMKRFLNMSGILTLLLGLDDALLLHEQFFPSIGIPETVVLAIYGGLTLFYLIRFYSRILKTEYILLGMAFFFFGMSIVLDLLPLPGINPYVLEDSAKLAGIVSWLAYFSYAGASAIALDRSPSDVLPAPHATAQPSHGRSC